MSHRGKLRCRDDGLRPAQSCAIRFGPSQPGPDSLRDSRPLELSQRSQDMELQTSGGRGAVDTLVERDEGHAQRVELIQQRHEMPEPTPEAVQAPTGDHIDTATSNVAHKGIQSRPAIL